MPKVKVFTGKLRPGTRNPKNVLEALEIPINPADRAFVVDNLTDILLDVGDLMKASKGYVVVNVSFSSNYGGVLVAVPVTIDADPVSIPFFGAEQYAEARQLIRELIEELVPDAELLESIRELTTKVEDAAFYKPSQSRSVDYN